MLFEGGQDTLPACAGQRSSSKLSAAVSTEASPPADSGQQEAFVVVIGEARGNPTIQVVVMVNLKPLIMQEDGVAAVPLMTEEEIKSEFSWSLCSSSLQPCYSKST